MCEPEYRYHRPGIAQVETFTDSLRIFNAAYKTINKVINIAPGSDLVAIAVYLYIFIFQCSLNENLYGTFTCLTRTIHIKRSHSNDRQFILVIIRVREMFTCQFRHGVRPPCFAS